MVGGSEVGPSSLTNDPLICHPEALLLREGSPEMSGTQMHFPWLLGPLRFVRGGGALQPAFLSDASREILRAEEALQDDKPYTQ